MVEKERKEGWEEVSRDEREGRREGRFRERRQPRMDMRGKDERGGGRKVGGKGEGREGRMGERRTRRRNAYWVGCKGEG